MNVREAVTWPPFSGDARLGIRGRQGLGHPENRHVKLDERATAQDGAGSGCVHGWFRGKEWEELDWARTEPGSEQKVSQPEHEGEKKNYLLKKSLLKRNLPSIPQEIQLSITQSGKA